MYLHVDGHSIPLFTDADIPNDAKSQQEFNETVTIPVGDDGSFSTALPGSLNKAIPYTVPASDMDTHMPSNFTFVQPPGGDDMNFASMRPVRLMSKPNHRTDAVHQVRLFHAVGSVAVAGGHVEMAMKRVLVTLRGGKNSDLAGADLPADWYGLEKELKKASKPQNTDLQKAVFTLVAEPAVPNLREDRNDVVHGYWWLIPTSTKHFISSRYYRPSKNEPQDPGQMVPTPQMLQKLAGDLFDLAHALDALVTPHWPLAIVPAANSLGNRDIELDTRPDRHRTNSADLRPPEPKKPKPGQRPAGSTGQSRRRKK